MTPLKGLTAEETEALRMLFAFGMPNGKSPVQKRIAKYLDGDKAALDKTPKIKAHFERAIKLAQSESFETKARRSPEFGNPSRYTRDQT